MNAWKRRLCAVEQEVQSIRKDMQPKWKIGDKVTPSSHSSCPHSYFWQTDYGRTLIGQHFKLKRRVPAEHAAGHQVWTTKNGPDVCESCAHRTCGKNLTVEETP